MHFCWEWYICKPPSEHEELYIVYNCSLERTVLHEYSYIYFCFNLKCLCRVPYAEQIKQMEEVNYDFNFFTI